MNAQIQFTNILNIRALKYKFMPSPMKSQKKKCLSCYTLFNWWETDGEGSEINTCPSCGWNPETWIEEIVKVYE